MLVIPTYGQRKKKEDDEVITTPVFLEGIIYSLPRTGIRVYVKAMKEDFVPGPYAGYAEQLLGLKDVKIRPETKWTVTEIRIDAFAEPDPEQVYKAMGDAAFKINLTADGRIAGINLPNVTPQPTALRTNKVAQIPDTLDNFSFDFSSSFFGSLKFSYSTRLNIPKSFLFNSSCDNSREKNPQGIFCFAMSRAIFNPKVVLPLL